MENRQALITGAAAVAIAAVTVSAFARALDASSLQKQLVGSWRLITWEERDSSNVIHYPLGPDAVGQISYTNDGRMSAQLMRRATARFASEDWRRATPQEKSGAWGNYFGYFGEYSLDLANRAIVHRIEGSWFPNLVGTDQVRHFRFEGNQLILDADTEWGKVHIVWEKVGAGPAS